VIDPQAAAHIVAEGAVDPVILTRIIDHKFASAVGTRYYPGAHWFAGSSNTNMTKTVNKPTV
jgi:hypothetical protein